MHSAALHIADRVANVAATLAKTLREVDLERETRAEILAVVSRLAQVIDGDNQPRIIAVFAELDNAVQVMRVTGKSLSGATADAIEGLHLAIGPSDALAINRKWLRKAIVLWPTTAAGAVHGSKYEAVYEALRNTSFAMKQSSIKTALADYRSGRRKPPRRKKKRTPAK